MNYWQRKAKQRQCIVNMLIGLAILAAGSCVGFVISAAPCLAIGCAVAAVILSFAAVAERIEVRSMRAKGEMFSIPFRSNS